MIIKKLFTISFPAALGAAFWAVSGVLSAHASDDEAHSVEAPIFSKDAADVEKPEIKTPTPEPEAPGADVVDLPPKKHATDPRANAPEASPALALEIDTALDEKILKEKLKGAKPPAEASSSVANEKNTPKPLRNVAPDPVADPRLQMPSKPLSEPGYATVLSGTLQANTELNAEALPHLIRGMLIVPAKVTLKINAGATVHLRADAGAAKPLQSGSPDPTKSAAVWVYGTLLVCGENGRPVEFAGQDKDNANLLLYSGEQSKIDGARFKAADIAQNGGVCQWTNCEFNDSKYYALASGTGQFTHCTFKKCGGIFAAYDEGPWALLVRRSLFENCRDGLLLNRDPGPGCLLIEKNNFIGTRGANLRIMPRAGSAGTKTAEELLIGENWYGTTVEEDIDRRIVDRRTDPGIKAHLNTRPPAEKPFANTGAGAAQTSIANTVNDQQAASAKMIAAVAAKQKAAIERAKVAMEKTAVGRDGIKKDIKN